MGMKKQRFRNKYIMVYLTPQEKEMILDRTQRCRLHSCSDYLRIMGIDGCIFVVDDSQLIDKVCYEIHKIGVNINQIAHVANTNQTISLEEIKKVQEYQKEIWRLQNCILSSTLPYQQ